MKKRIYDTSLPNSWTKRLFEEFLFDVPEVHFDKIANVIFCGTAGALNGLKKGKEPIAMVFRKANGDFIAASFVEYFENEDPNLPGNYSMAWTFYEEDIPANATILDFTNKSVFQYYIGVAGSKYGMDFDRESSIVILATTILEESKKWLDENVKETDITEVEIPGVCLLRAAVENGEKTFAIDAMGEIKALVKNDASIEK